MPKWQAVICSIGYLALIAFSMWMQTRQIRDARRKGRRIRGITRLRGKRRGEH